LVDKSGALRPQQSLLYHAPLLHELASFEISRNALKGLKENTVASAKIRES
jgi:hypothetical protein